LSFAAPLFSCYIFPMIHTILLLAALAAPPFPVNPVSPTIAVTAVQTGVTATSLSTTPWTNPIDMEATWPTHQLSLSLAVTPGTTTSFVVKCYESQTATMTNPELISPCDASGACTPDSRTYTIANYASVAGVYTIPSRWVITKRYARCNAYNSGSGTITITGVRS
jgi:hypothetical protein